VGEECGFPGRIIQSCIGTLPVEDLSGSIPRASSDEAQRQSTHIAGTDAFSHAERIVLDAMTERGLACAAACYVQALRDIAQPNRVSWRGVAAEFREVLREVIDHLAPDEQVRAVPDFRPEGKDGRPSQTQRVVFALRTRRASDVAIKSDRQALSIVEEMIARLARSTDDRGSISTHNATDAAEVRTIQGYVDALLGELLRRTWPE
jgi:hypothetical protein